MKSKRRINTKNIIGIGVLLASAALITVLVLPKSDTSEEIIWREYKAEIGKISASFDGTGVISLEEETYSPPANLVIDKIFVKAGQEVKKGDKLVSYSKENLQKQLDETESSLEKAMRALEDAKNNITEKKLQHKSNKNEAEQSAEKQYQTQKKETERTISTLERDIRRATEKQESLLRQIQDARNSKDGSDTTSQALKNLLDEKSRLEDELSWQQQNMQDNDHRTNIAALEQERSALQNQYNDLQTQIAGLPSDDAGLPALQEQLRGLVRQIESLNSQINALQSSYSYESEIAKLQNRIAKLQDDINNLTKNQTTIESLNTELEQLERTLETYRDGLSDAQAKLKDLQADYSTQVSQMNQDQATQNQIYGLALTTLEHAVENAQSEVDKLERKVLEFREIMETSTVTAKADGVVTSINYNEGAEVKADQGVLSIGAHGDNYVKVQMSQGEINKVALGQQVELSFSAYSDSVFKGTVIGKNHTPTQGYDGVVYEVLIKLDKTDEEILNGMTCTAKFIIKRMEGVLTLSNKAIRIQNGKQVVTLRLPDGTMEEHTITTGFSDGRVSEITGGLNAGDTVVVEG